jgi:sigma-B regulation protein RsbU (phosphoserine phosphatase)
LGLKFGLQIDQKRFLMMKRIRGINIKLRWKFFIVLLIFSLTPLIVVTVISQRGTLLLRKTVSDEARMRLTEIVGMELRQTAENSAKVLLRTKDAMEFYLQVLVGEAERAFMGMTPENLEIYFAKDFEDPRSAPKDFLPSDRYTLKTHDGQFLSNSVSFDQPVFLLAPGIKAETVSEDIARLTQMIPILRKLSHEFGKTLHWAYVGLQNGVYMSYPGHSGYLDGFDPKRLPWYTNAKNTPTWTLPQIEDTTGLLTFTVSKRLYRPDGSFLGVAAIDILFIEALQKSELSPLWESNALSFIVTSAISPATHNSGLQILAQKDYQKTPGAWVPNVKGEWLSSIEISGFDIVLKNLKIGRSGYITLPFNGVESIWAYAGIDDRTHFVIIVPKSIIMDLPEKTSQTFIEYIKDQILFAGTAVILTVVFLAAAALIGSYVITKSLLRISAAAKKLSSGDFTVRLGLRTGDERDLVIQAFNEMGPKLEDHLRLHQSIDLAMKVQQKLLPSANPKIPGLDIAGKSIYCDETGGDYFDYFDFDTGNTGKVGIVVGDVSGHGISSALMMASARAFLRQRISLPGSLAQIISDVNSQLARDIADSNNFLTLLYLRIDSKAKILDWVRAGHDPAIFYDPKTDSFEELNGLDIPLGVDESWEYKERRKTDISEKQIIVIGTDGVWEARNPEGDMFGKDRVYELIRNNAASSAHEILNAFIKTLYQFTKGQKFEDDVTLVVVKLK